jgi:lantibiotic modifying enzyme
MNSQLISEDTDVLANASAALIEIEQHLHSVDLSRAALVQSIAGSLTFFCECFAADPNPNDLRTIRRIISEILRRLPDFDVSDIGLHTGLAGVAWATNHALSCCGSDALDIDEAATDEIDQFLLDLISSGNDFHYDMISGLVGVGHYALSRRHNVLGRSIVRAVLLRLHESAETRNGRSSWLTPVHHLPRHERATHPRGWYNLGLAHGVPGVIAFLARSTMEGHAGADDIVLLRSATSWFLEQSNSSGHLSFGPTTESSFKRSAWCYGDLGAAVGLFSAAMALDDASLKCASLDLAFRSLSESTASSGVVDASLCHGSSGLAHIAGRFYKYSGQPRFRAAQLRWMRILLDGTALDRFAFYSGVSKGMELDPGYLNGLAGIGLVIRDFVGDAGGCWDLPLSTQEFRH